MVLDASAVVGALLEPERHPAVLAALEEGAPVVPHLCDVEVAATLRRILRLGEMDGETAEEALSVYMELPLRRMPHLPVLPRAFALRENVTPYDGVYVALAEGLDAPLLTADARLARAARACTALEVEEV